LIKDVFRDTKGLIQYDSVVKCPKCSFAFESNYITNGHSWRDIRKAERIRWNAMTPEEQQKELENDIF
jgi:hypothetical protein